MQLRGATGMRTLRVTCLLSLLLFVPLQQTASAAVPAPQAELAEDNPALVDRVIDSVLTDNGDELDSALREVRGRLDDQEDTVHDNVKGEEKKTIFSTSQLKEMLDSVLSHQTKADSSLHGETDEKYTSGQNTQDVTEERNTELGSEKEQDVNGKEKKTISTPQLKEILKNVLDHNTGNHPFAGAKRDQSTAGETMPVADSAVETLPVAENAIGSGSNTHEKKSAKVFLAQAAKDIGTKVVDKLGDRIAEGVVENHQEEVVNGLQNYFSSQLEDFDKQYQEALESTGNLAAGLSRPVEEADIRVIPYGRGDDMGNTFVPAGYEISHRYQYADEDEDEQDAMTPSGAYSYPTGLGPVMMNGCFGTAYEPGDPCYASKIPQTNCPSLIDGATFLGVGFDGRGEYSADSRKRSIIQRSCNNLQTYEDYEVPDSMTVQGVYDTDVESNTFASMEGYRQYLEQKSAVTSATAMFQEELNKASGYGAVGGAFGLGWSAGGGTASQNGRRSESSNFEARSRAEGGVAEKNTQTFMAMLEINVLRYEIFMDDVKPADLNLAFLWDFLRLPVSYFSIGADTKFQNFILRYGAHYIQSAKFGGQLKIIKTKEASSDLSVQAFSERAQTDWKKTFSTFSAEASMTKSSSWFHKHETKEESENSEGEASQDTEKTSQDSQTEQTSSFEFSNELMVVQGGDQQIAAAITEMYTSSLNTELKAWLDSIKDYPKAFSFVMKPITAALDINFNSLFPNGDVDFGCLGQSDLEVENGTDRRYYIQEKTVTTADNETREVSEIRYCDFNKMEELAEKAAKRRLALGRAITVYLEEGPVLSTDFLLPAGEPGCETATLAYLDGSNSGAPTWDELVSGDEFTVIFDMPYGISSILQAWEMMTVKFKNNRWFSFRTGETPHLYDGYDNGGSNDINGHKVSIQGLVMTYDEETGVFTVTESDFEESNASVPALPGWVEGQEVARAEYHSLLQHLSKQSSTTGDAPCNIKWSNAHRLDPTNGGKCIHFTIASEGDIFIVFAGIPQKHETWVYVQISPEGVALYKSMRLLTTQLQDGASSLGSSNLYQSYFVCITEDTAGGVTTIQYGKTPDNEERPHVWLDFEIDEILSLQYYAFGSGMYPVKVMGVSIIDQPAQDFIVCREGTRKDHGRCSQQCHEECDGCRTTGSDSPTDCIACKHYSVGFPYIEGDSGSFTCVATCPEHMEPAPGTKKCTCMKQMEESGKGGTVTCVTECPLTHYDDGNVCKVCSTFCKDVSGKGTRVCTGPNSGDCSVCRYTTSDGACLEGCSPGQKAVAQDEGGFRCDQCQPGHKCVRGDEMEEICPAGTHSSPERNSCLECTAGQFSSSGSQYCQECPSGKYSANSGASTCTACPSGQYSSSSGSSSCQVCPAGQYGASTGATSCQDCPAGQFSRVGGSSSCDDCPAGQYSADAGSSSCEACAEGYTSEEGATECYDWDDCSPNPCENNGVCTDGVNSFTCACQDRYTGDRCQVRPACPANFREYGTKCFHLGESTVNYYTARSRCRAAQSQLAMPKDEATNTFIADLIRSSQRPGGSYWIGLGFDEDEDWWTWEDNTPLGWKNWKPGEPNNSNENCVHFIPGSDEWGGGICGAEMYYVCQRNAV
ncbi:uncharacterized protein LOC144875283 [Branchiostoma floridae x Branchiostoma japonicum]